MLPKLKESRHCCSLSRILRCCRPRWLCSLLVYAGYCGLVPPGSLQWLLGSCCILSPCCCNGSHYSTACCPPAPPCCCSLQLAVASSLLLLLFLLLCTDCMSQSRLSFFRFAGACHSEQSMCHSHLQTARVPSASCRLHHQGDTSVNAVAVSYAGVDAAALVCQAWGLDFRLRVALPAMVRALAAQGWYLHGMQTCL